MDKYIQQFGQIYLAIWTNTSKAGFQFGRVALESTAGLEAPMTVSEEYIKKALRIANHSLQKQRNT